MGTHRHMRCKHRSAGKSGFVARLKGWAIKCVWPATGLIALAWFLIRVIPKPSRATYPCQRAAFPIASGFVIYLAGLVGTALAFRRARQRIRQARYLLAAICVGVGLAVTFFTISYNSETVKGQSGPPNVPIGQAKGIYPGRVVWVHDPNATYWDPTWNDRSDILFWDDEHTDSVVIEEMISKAIRWLVSERDDPNAWQALFRDFNVRRGKGSIGYTTGEKIIVKPNHNNQKTRATTNENCPDTPPSVYLALLKQLVYNAGVPEECIFICDSIRFIDDKTYNKCNSVFPNVHYLEKNLEENLLLVGRKELWVERLRLVLIRTVWD